MQLKEPKLNRDQSKALASTKFLNLYDLSYENGVHYYDASRRKPDTLFAYMDKDKLGKELPDAATAFVIVKEQGQADKLLLFYEYRYPTGSYMLGLPAGLIDPADLKKENPILDAMKREIKEETGLTVKDTDQMELLSHLVFTATGFSDESNALVKAVVHVDDLSELNHNGAEGTELFGDFKLVDQAEAKKLLKNGRDDYGHYLPLITWTALTYFVSDLWK